MIIAFSRAVLTVSIGGNVLNFGFRSKGHVTSGPLKFARSYFIFSPTQMYMRFGFVPRGQVNPPPVILKFARKYYAFSPTQMFVRFGFVPRGTVTPTPPPVKIIDTHDAVKKKKKKKQRDFSEEIDRRKKIREQIEEVIHPTPEILPPLTPDRIPEEVTIIEPLRTYRISPVIDYAGLARDEIVAKLKHDAILKARQYQDEVRRIELKRIADEEEEEEELMMILGTIL